MVSKNGSSAEVATVSTEPLPDDAFLGVESYQDAMKVLAQNGVGEIDNAGDVLGDGFPLLEKKDSLLETPFVLLDWRFILGDFGEYVSARGITTAGQKFRLNDGSTGIYRQLESYTRQSGKRRGLAVPAGLTRSDYEYTDDKGNTTPASTYYLATS
jgi:hypothetical protein